MRARDLAAVGPLLLCTQCRAQVVPAPSATVAGDAGSSATLARLGPDDVLGTVLGPVIGKPPGPVVGANVRVGGVVTQTDADGHFVVRNAPASYELDVVASPTAYVFVGLTTRSPVVRTNISSAPPATGPVPPGPMLHVVYPSASSGTAYSVFFHGPDVTTQELAGASSPSATSAIFYGAATGTLTALSFTTTYASGTGSPKAFVGVANEQHTFTQDESFTWSPTFTPVDQITVTGTATTQPGQTVYEAYELIRFGADPGYVALESAPATTLPWTFALPSLPGASTAIRYEAYDDGKQGSLGGNEIDAVVPVVDGALAPVTLPAPPLLTAPSAGTDDVGPGTSFAWSGEGACVVSLDALPASIKLAALGGSVVMPDLSALGFALPAHVSVQNTVSCSTRLDGSYDEELLLPPLPALAGFFGRSFVGVPLQTR